MRLLTALERRIPDLNKAEYMASLLEIYNQERLGATPEEKAANLKRIHQLIHAVNWAAIGAGCWAYFFPRPYPAVIWSLALFPLVGLALLIHYEGGVRLLSMRNDAFPKVYTLFLAPAVALTLRAVLDWHFLNWNPFYAPFAMISASGGLALLVARELRRTAACLGYFALFLLLYGYGATACLNGVLADSPVTSYHAKVQEKHTREGKVTLYYLTVSPWGNRGDPNEVMVPRGTYSNYKSGDTVGILVRTGKFGIPFYLVQ